VAFASADETFKAYDAGPSGSFEMISGSTMLSSGAEARRRSA
jgi:hypothetical protein